MLPISKTINGTAVGSSAFVFFPDWQQNPFNVGVNIVLTAAATWSVQGTRDYGTTSMPTWNGSSSVAWFNLGAADFTASMQAQYTTPVTAIRVLVSSATDTASLLVNVAQSVNSP